MRKIHEKNSKFVNSLQSFTPTTQKDTIDLEEVQKIESWLYHNCIDIGYGQSELESDKLYTRDFVEKVIARAEELKREAPVAIFNLRRISDGTLILYCTYKLKDIAYLRNCFVFGSKADALACREQLLQLKQCESEEELPDEQLMCNIEGSLDYVENQLEEFDDLSK